MSLKIDFSAGNSSSSRDYERGRNDGVRDIGPPGNGNRVLFIRGLDSETSQEDLRDRLGAEIVRLAGASSVASKFPIMDGRPAIMRVVLIRHRNSKSSCGLAFVELASTELASALLAHLLSRIAQPVGFVVRSRPVACSFANPDAFVEAGEEGKPPAQTSWLIHGTAAGGLGNTTNWVKHRDDWLGASEITVGGDLEENLKSYLQSLIVPNEDAVARSRGKKEVTETAAPTLLDRSGGGIKLQPLKAGFTKKKEREDVMVPLSVNGAPIANALVTSGRPRYIMSVHASSPHLFDPPLSATGSPANVLGETEDDEELTALPSKSEHVRIE
jgi:RNA-binding protein 5/10